MPAVLFGSISTLADTSELQRAAFNQAFQAHGLDWHWDQADYRASLASNGGQNRIAEYARSRDEQVDAGAVHQTKSELYQQSLAETEVAARPGVLETISAAKEAGYKLGLVTTTSRANVSALLAALGPELTMEDFDVVVDASSVEDPKPNRAAYEFALDALDESAESCVAIEDNIGGVQSAHSAAVACVAFPNENTAGHNFEHADRRVDRLDLDELSELIKHD